MKMFACPLHFQVPERDFAASFLPVLTALCFPGQSPLISPKSRRRLLEMAWVLNLFPSAQRRETLDADIHADSLSGLREWRRFRHFADKQRIPAVGAARNPKLFAAPFHR